MIPKQDIIKLDEMITSLNELIEQPLTPEQNKKIFRNIFHIFKHTIEVVKYNQK